MEKLNDILRNIKDRFTNPLVFSFICAWLLFNWEIVLGLAWDDSEQIEKLGYSTIFEFIRTKLSVCGSIAFPIITAFTYTLVAPLTKNLIRAFYSWVSKWGDEWNLKILKESKIPLNRYLKLRSDHEIRTKVLEDVIIKESSILSEYNETKTELLSTQSELNRVRSDLNEYKDAEGLLFDANILNGNWTCRYKFVDGQEGFENINIIGSNYQVSGPFGQSEIVFHVTDFVYNRKTKRVFFVKELTSEQKAKRPLNEHFSVNRLRFDGNDKLVGTENTLTNIEYIRIK